MLSEKQLCISCDKEMFKKSEKTKKYKYCFGCWKVLHEKHGNRLCVKGHFINKCLYCKNYSIECYHCKGDIVQATVCDWCL